MSRTLVRLVRAVGRGTGTVRRSRWTRRFLVATALTLVSLGGATVGMLLLAQTSIDVGPFRAEMSVAPSWSGGTVVRIPPLGSLHLDSHDGPIHLRVDLGSLDQERTEDLIDNPAGIGAAGQGAVDDVTAGVLRLGLRALGAAVLGALLASALVFRTMRRVAAAGVLALTVSAASLGAAAATLRPGSLSEPRYEGLLVNAPAVVGDARRIADNYGRYADQLAQLVGNVSRIYTTVSSLPVYAPAGNTTRILHVSDLHLNPASWGLIRTVVEQFDIDAVVDTGDIVDWGSSAETQYVSAIAGLGVPYVWVRGNHDSAAIQAAVARQRNARVLDDDVVTVAGVTFAGIGDPEFTPDKRETEEAPAETSPHLLSGRRLADTVRAAGRPVQVALVHDPAMAAPLSGVVPLVLAGHGHQREVSLLPAPEPPTPAPGASPAAAPAATGSTPTRLMVQGSTGGAGLRGLEDDEPTPLSLSVLYFDERQQLKAYDDIQLAGTGRSQVTLERKVVGSDTDLLAEPRPSVPVTTPSTPVGSSRSGG